jgi:hypothetical protein
MKRLLPLIITLALVVAYGIAEGVWTNRWISSAALERATARLSDVPRVVGAWEGTDDELDPRQVAQAEMSGYVMRRYVHQQTGAALSVMLVCGRAGPTSLHSPQSCYPGIGYQPGAAPQRQAIGGQKPAADDFWVAQFKKEGPRPEVIRIFWSWNGAGKWQAADSPRLQFARHTALYKLYVIRSLGRADEGLADDPALDFLEQFLPAVERALFAPAPGTGGSDS